MRVIEQLKPKTKILKTQLKETWVAGDFGRIAKATSNESEEFINRLNLQHEMKVLDITCGTGNLSIPAARTGAAVTGIDIAPNLLREARCRAASEDLEVQFDEGDVERLPYKNDSFGVVISMFGAMFAPRPDLVIAELFRVCRPGGVIAMANWTPQGFIGQLYQLTRLYSPSLKTHPSPFLWGDISGLAAFLGDAVADFHCCRRSTTLKFPFGAKKTVEYWCANYGPTRSVFTALNDPLQSDLQRDMERLFSSNNISSTSDDDALIESEYLEVIVTLKD